ncbi:MAG: sigma-70 family RNA polymerase sigma factor [Planctomycetes bacterium]|nr:sigma-70 family RNA polymerase sigma factor [Planctomycetota bacterium]
MDEDVGKLAELAARGDRAALNRLLERYLPELRAFVRLRAGAVVRARESNSDIVQSTCREVLQHMERFQFPSEAAFKQWLYTTALRKIINRKDYYLAQKRDALREVPLAPSSTSDDEQRLMDCYRSFSSPSRHAMVKEELERVERAFEQLPEEYREVITLAHVVGLSRAEIAEHMGKSEGNVRVLLHRALAKMSAILSPPAPPPVGG